MKNHDKPKLPIAPHVVPIKPTKPPVRLIRNEKVLNRKELDDWDNRHKK